MQLLVGYFNYHRWPTYLLQRVLRHLEGGEENGKRGREKEAGNACTRESFSNCPKNETKRSLELHCSNSWIPEFAWQGGESASNFPRLNIESHANPSVAL